MVLCHFVKLGIVAYCILLYLCIVDGQTRRVPSGELKDHFPSDGSEQTTTTSGVEEEIHIRKKVVGTSIINDSRKKPVGKRICFSTGPRRKPKPLSLSPSKRLSQSAKQQRTSPKKKSTVSLSPLKSEGEGGRTVRERAGSYSDGTVRFNLVIAYTCRAAFRGRRGEGQFPTHSTTPLRFIVWL